MAREMPQAANPEREQRWRKVICRAAGIIVVLVSAVGRQFAWAQEPHVVVRTEFGSEYSDGSSTVVGDSATFIAHPSFVLLKIDSGRPVYRAVLTLQTRYGRVITYEDPRYTNEDDLQDVSAEVVKNYARYAPGTAPRVIVPRGGELTVRLPVSTNISSHELGLVLQQLVSAQATSHRGGHFRVEQDGDVFHVVPTEVRDRKGKWSRFSSPLDTPISLSKEDRTEDELYRAITGAINGKTRVYVLINGGIVIGILQPPIHTMVAATLEPARRVLMRALQAHRGRRTWALLNNPESSGDEFVLNLWDLPAQAISQSTRPLTSDVLMVFGSDYAFVDANRMTGGPATVAERQEALGKAEKDCRERRQRMVLLPLAKHTAPGIPAVVFRCVPAPELENARPERGMGTAGTVVPQR